MKPLLIFFMLISFFGFSQNEYIPSDTHPYGLPNPNAPEQIKDFHLLIGKCNCESTLRNQDGTWAETQNITWEWKYIMNGMAVQDETIKPDGNNSGSIRQFIADSSKWYVHYYSTNFPTTKLPTWEGNKVSNDSIVLYRDQKAPNGMDGKYRISFYNMNDLGYSWIGEWVDVTEKIVYPTWKIECKRDSRDNSDLGIIKNNIAAFSKAYMNDDIASLVDMYTDDGKIMPNNRKILAGKSALSSYWNLPEGVKILNHKVTPTEINIQNDIAYDFGYYEGTTLTKEQQEVSWKGKYVIIWKKIGNDWKIYLDIWNNVAE
ncbi:YybH family protein [Winogradskyella vincentii]|uniref:Nuclear transport factor 2 family protein n=1 Tax=Winogradskyella vincentii TaxID=2877122 RepID=A0ABS7Y377_9FLAO|nr:nuclear transport factor 2 family protein [Winogradskyella vincentii]MCA0154388.1 nuclear transport factor 2 family protein [Winogradskyella vincentii]